MKNFIQNWNFSINPTTMIWLNILYATLTGISAPMLQAAGIADYQHVIAWMSMAAFPLNLILHSFSSTNPGPLAPPDPTTK